MRYLPWNDQRSPSIEYVRSDRRLQKKVPEDGETVEKLSVNQLIESMHDDPVGFIGYQLAHFSVLPNIELTDVFDQKLFYGWGW